MDLNGLLRLMRRRWRTVVVFAVIGSLCLVVAGTALEKESSPATQFFVAKRVFSGTGSNLNLARDEALGALPVVAERVGSRTGADPAISVAEKVVVEAQPDVRLLFVAAGDADPAKAVTLADTYADELLSFLREVELLGKQKIREEQQIEVEALHREYERNRSREMELPLSEEASDLAQRQEELSQEITDAEQALSSIDFEPAASEGLFAIGPTRAEPAPKKEFDLLVKGRGAEQASIMTTLGSQSAVDGAISGGKGLGIRERLLLGGIFGALLGALAVVALARLDPRLRSKTTTEWAFELPVLAEVPHLSRSERREPVLFVADQPRSREAEAYRGLRLGLDVAAMDSRTPAANLDFSESLTTMTTDPSGSLMADGGGVEPAGNRQVFKASVVLVTSASPGEGKTSTVANLAAAYAERGDRVLVINGDHRHPRVHRMFGLPLEPDVVHSTGIEGVALVADVSGPTRHGNASDIVCRQRQLIGSHSGDFDVILIDAAPVLATNDTTELLEVADTVLLVARAGRSTPEQAHLATELLGRRHTHMAGVVLVGVREQVRARPGDFDDYETAAGSDVMGIEHAGIPQPATVDG